MTEQIKKVDLTGVTYELAVEEAKRLYGTAENAWIELCLYLREIENSGLWQRGPESFANWDQFMHATFPASFGPLAYRNRLAAIEGYGVEVARHLPPEATASATRPSLMGDPVKKEQFGAAVMDHVKTHGVKPSAKVCRTLVRELTRDVSPVPQHRRLASVDEARALRSQLAAANAEIDKLREQNKKLRAEVRSLKRAAA